METNCDKVTFTSSTHTFAWTKTSYDICTLYADIKDISAFLNQWITHN